MFYRKQFAMTSKRRASFYFNVVQVQAEYASFRAALLFHCLEGFSLEVNGGSAH